MGHVAPVVLAVLAGVFVLAGLRDRASMISVPVAGQNIPAGAVVNGGDTRLVKVHRSDVTMVAGLLPSASLGEGWVAVAAIGQGEPITRSAVTQQAVAGSGLGSMSIPVPVDQADGGGIAAGDLVDVIAPSANGGASYLAQGLRVLSVAASRTSGALGGSTSDYYVVVAVDRATALRVAAALGSSSSGGRSGGVQVVRSTGEATSSAASGSKGAGAGG